MEVNMLQRLNSLKDEREVKIIRAIIEELKLENQKELLIIRIMDQITNIYFGKTMSKVCNRQGSEYGWNSSQKH